MKKWLIIIGESIVVGFLVFVLTFFNALSSFDYIAKDHLYQIPRGIDNKIKIIGKAHLVKGL